MYYMALVVFAEYTDVENCQVCLEFKTNNYKFKFN